MRKRTRGPEFSCVRDLLQPQGVLLHADIHTTADVLGILVELQEKSGAITNGTAYYNAVCERETAGGSTGIGAGIALPHACSAAVAAPGITAVTLRKPVDWGACDGRPVDLIFLLALPPQAESLRLQLLARLVNLLSDKELLATLRRAVSRGSFIEAVAGAEAERFA